MRSFRKSTKPINQAAIELSKAIGPHNAAFVFGIGNQKHLLPKKMSVMRISRRSDPVKYSAFMAIKKIIKPRKLSSVKAELIVNMLVAKTPIDEITRKVDVTKKIVGAFSILLFSVHKRVVVNKTGRQAFGRAAPVPQDVLTQIQAYARFGVPNKVISQMTGKPMGLVIKMSGGIIRPFKKLSTEKLNQAVELARQGKSFAEIKQFLAQKGTQ